MPWLFSDREWKKSTRLIAKLAYASDKFVRDEQ